MRFLAGVTLAFALAACGSDPEPTATTSYIDARLIQTATPTNAPSVHNYVHEQADYLVYLAQPVVDALPTNTPTPTNTPVPTRVIVRSTATPTTGVQAAAVPLPANACMEAAAQYDWPLDEVARIIRAESGGNPYAQNAMSGACGCMQLLPCQGLGDPNKNVAAGYAKWVDGGGSFWKHWYQWWPK